MKKNVFLLLNIFFLSFTVSNAQIIIPSPEYCNFNHAASILYLPSKTTLPNGDTLVKSRIIVTAFGGLSEGKNDNIVWTSVSDDYGKSWSLAKNITDDSMFSRGDTLARDPLVFKVSNNTVFVLFRVQNREGSGESGGPCIGYYKKSIDGGLTFTDAYPLEVDESKDSTFRNFTSLSRPLIKGDSMYFPFYYRILGNKRPNFAVLITDTNFINKRVVKVGNLGFASDFSLIEPIGLLSENKLTVYFRNASGLIYYSESSNGVSWSDALALDFANCDSEFDIISLENKLILASNGRSGTVRDDLTLTVFGKDTSYVLLDKLDDKSVTQVSYPSIDYNDSIIFCVYSKMTRNDQNLRFGQIVFKSINIYQDTKPVVNKSKIIKPINFSTSISSVLINEGLSYFLTKNGLLYGLNQDFNFTGQIVKIDSQFNRVKTFCKIDSSILFGGNFTNFSYGKLDLRTNNTFYYKLPKSIVEMKINDSLKVFLSINRSEIFFNGLKFDSDWKTLSFSNKVIINWVLLKNNKIVCLFDDNSISEIDLLSRSSVTLINPRIEKVNLLLAKNENSDIIFSSLNKIYFYERKTNSTKLIYESKYILNNDKVCGVEFSDNLVFFATSSQGFFYDSRLNFTKLIFDISGLFEVVGLKINQEKNHILVLTHSGAILTYELDNFTITGIRNYSQSDNTSVYPNPFTNHIYIDNSSSYFKKIRIYSLDGKLVFNGLVNQSTERINLERLKSGFYLLELKNKNNSNIVLKKIVKQ